MQPFNIYITGQSDGVDPAELDRLLDRYEWFSTARRARAALTGRADPRLTLSLVYWPTISPEKRLQPETVCASAEERIIERFLERGGYRIVPDESPDTEIPDAASFAGDDDDVLPTEDLAEIYRSQGLYAEAEEIYNKLSLRNPEKSIYFADAIARMNAEKEGRERGGTKEGVGKRK